MAEKKNLAELLKLKKFLVPKYQRGYSWEEEQCRDLFEDILEVEKSGRREHYYGTIILRDTGESVQVNYEQWKKYEVVDGQQRLATSLILLSQVLQKLENMNSTGIITIKNYLKQDDSYRLDLLGDDDAYFKELLEGRILDPQTRSQRRLRDAAEYFRKRLSAFNNQEIQQLLQILLNSFKVLIFEESDSGMAVVIFSTVNDRGKPLSNLDKAKSTLMSYSTFYLGGSLDDLINDRFGKVFRLYDKIKSIGEDMEIALIKGREFSEDNIFVYHYIPYGRAFDDWNYDATPEYVLKRFLKAQLESKKSSKNDLRSFIEGYIEDLQNFFAAFYSMLNKLDTNCTLKKLIKMLNMSAYLYPLAVRLEQNNLLDGVAGLLENVDLRVYKVRGTNPRADMYSLAADVAWNNLDQAAVEQRLREFINRFMADGEFEFRLRGNAADLPVKYILAEYEACAVRNDPLWLCSDEGEIAYKAVQVDHILPQKPQAFPRELGFKDPQDYAESISRLGNFTLFKQNPGAHNLMPPAKANMYISQEEPFRATADLGGRILKKGNFDKSDLENRTDELVKFCLNRW